MVPEEDLRGVLWKPQISATFMLLGRGQVYVPGVRLSRAYGSVGPRLGPAFETGSHLALVLVRAVKAQRISASSRVSYDLVATLRAFATTAS